MATKASHDGREKKEITRFAPETAKADKEGGGALYEVAEINPFYFVFRGLLKKLIDIRYSKVEYSTTNPERESSHVSVVVRSTLNIVWGRPRGATPRLPVAFAKVEFKEWLG